MRLGVMLTNTSNNNAVAASKRNLFLSLLLLHSIPVARGHGELVYPRSRNSIDYEEVVCDANTDICSSVSKGKGNGCVNHTHPDTQPCMNGQTSFWYSQGCFIGCEQCDHVSGRRQTDLCDSGKQPTLPDYARSVNRHAIAGSPYDIYKHNPWRSPGNAPVADACGLAGGSPSKCDGFEAGYYVKTTHAEHGKNGTSLPPLHSGVIWEIGGVAEVSWQVRNNHGGGYSYRLCPLASLEENPITEDCFQMHPLEFDDSPDAHQLLFSNGTRVSYEPVIVSEGTQPLGSQWARIPVPPTNLGPLCLPGPYDDPDTTPFACGNPQNDHPDNDPCGCTPCPETPGSDCSRCDNCKEPSFPPVAYNKNNEPVQGVAPVVGILDRVKVPQNFPPGDYVLGWRYDCEATSQVWSNCADVTLARSTSATATATATATKMTASLRQN